MEFITIIGTVVFSIILIFFSTLIMLAAVEFYGDALRGSMGPQLKKYLHIKGQQALESIRSGGFDQGHIRDLLDASLSGSTPATLTLAELANAQENNRDNSIAWLYILQRSKPRRRSEKEKRIFLLNEFKEALGEISNEESALAEKRCDNFYIARKRFRNRPFHL